MAKRLRLVTVAMIVVGSGLVGTAGLAVESPKERAQIRVADRNSIRFDRAMSEFVRSTGEAISARALKVDTDYPALLEFVDARIAAAPMVSPRGTTTFGRGHSASFRGVKLRRDLALKPFGALVRYLKLHAVPDQAFVDAGKALVQVNPGKLLKGANFLTGAPIRELVIPAFVKARDRLKKQHTPANSGLLRFDLMTYAKDAISQAKSGAKKIDARQPFFFDLGSRPDALFQQLNALEMTIGYDLGVRVDVLKPAG